MPINPNIALGIQPVQQPNMLGQMGQIMAIRAAQQEMEGNEETRNYFAKPVSERGDPSQLLKTKQGQAAYKALNEGQIKQLEATQKRVNLIGAGAGAVLQNPTIENFRSVVENLVKNQVYSREDADKAIATIGNDPSKIPSFVTPLYRQAISAEKDLADQTSRANAATAAGPGNRQASIAEQNFAIQQRDRAELDALYGKTPTSVPPTTPMSGGGGGGGARPSISVNPMSNNGLRDQVAPTTPTAGPVNSLLNPPAGQTGVAPVAATPGDLYAQISAIDARIAQLPMNNPKAIPIAQALNAQRTALLASAKQEFGGNQFDMTVPNPLKPGEFMTVKGRMDQYGRAVPVEIAEPPLRVEASATGNTTISPSVVRPAPRVGYKYNELGEEVKIPQVGPPEGIKLRPGERWNEEKAIVEQVPGSALFIEQQKKHGNELNAVKTVQTTTKWGTDRIDKILDPKNKKGFENSFGGYTAYATKEFSGNTALVQSELASLKSDLKNKGLQMFRAGGSIGAMTEKEWPIIESMLATITPKMDVDDARAVLEEVRAKFEALEALAVEKYSDQWQNTQYFKPIEKTTGGGGGGGGTTVPQAAIDMLKGNPSLRADFDAKYGSGASSKYLGK